MLVHTQTHHDTTVVFALTLDGVLFTLPLSPSVPLWALPQVPGPGHLKVLRARAAHLLHAGILEDHAVGAALPVVPSRS